MSLGLVQPVQAEERGWAEWQRTLTKEMGRKASWEKDSEKDSNMIS